MEIIYIRHGERPSMQYDIDIIDKWKKSKRYKENYLDEPLTDKGIKESFQTGINLLKLIDIKNYDYIYSSPLERCMDTSVQIIDAIKKQTGKKLKIRIEYGLHETTRLDGKSYIIFDNTKIKQYFPDIYYNNSLNKYITHVIDEKLYFKNLVKKYGKYIDENYYSFVSENEYKIIPKAIPSVKYLADTLENITKKNKYILIVSHGGHNYVHSYYYLTKEIFDEEKYNNLFNSGYPDKLNFISIFRNYSHNNKKRWRCILEPMRIIKN